MISFCCKECGQKIKVSDKHAGKKGKCPKCRSVVLVPHQEDADVLKLSIKKPSSESLVNFRCVMCDDAVSAPESKRGEVIECPNCGSFAEVPVKEKVQVEPKVSYETVESSEEEFYDTSMISKQPDGEYSGKRKLPWFLDVFLYPYSVSGLFNLGLFIFAPLMISLLSMLLMPMACFFLVFRILVGAYFCWYIAECVSDSAIGGVRAPGVLASGSDDLGGLVGALANLIACYLVCFLPAAIYKTNVGQQDLIYWSLVGYSAVLFPLLFLSVVIIDSVSAWNPIMLFVAFIKLQPQYLIASAAFFVFLFVVHFLPKPDNILMSCLTFPVTTYVMFLGAHLLGRFYYLNSEKLDW